MSAKQKGAILSVAARRERLRLYRAARIETASLGRLLSILHEECCLRIKEAIAGGTGAGRRSLDRAQNALALLQRSLLSVDESDAAGQGLFHIYGYCYGLLENGSQDDLENALDLVDSLRALFGELAAAGSP